MSADSSLVPGPVSRAGREILGADPEGLVCKVKGVSVFVFKGRGREGDSREVWGAVGSHE